MLSQKLSPAGSKPSPNRGPDPQSAASGELAGRVEAARWHPLRWHSLGSAWRQAITTQALGTPPRAGAWKGTMRGDDAGRQRSVSSRDPDRDPVAPAPSPSGDLDARLRILRAVDLFRRVSDDELRGVADVSRLQRYDDAERVCSQGEPGRDLFAVVEGAVQVRRGSRVLARLGPGEVVGELAFLDRGKRSADVDAQGPTRLLVLPGEELDRLLDRQPSLARGLLALLASRMREAGERQLRVDQLVRAHRERGHVLAELDPLGVQRPGVHPELDPQHYGFADADLDLPVAVHLGSTTSRQPLRTVLERLRRVYCGSVGVQYMHIDDMEVQSWLRERLEDAAHQPVLERSDQLRILAKLTDAEVFELFLHQKFRGSFRFSLEGAETLIPLLDEAIEKAGSWGVEQVVVGMAHRGRLNVMANLLGKAPSQIFRELEDRLPEAPGGERSRAGDVVYHLGFSAPSAPPVAPRFTSSCASTRRTWSSSLRSSWGGCGRSRIVSVTPGVRRCCRSSCTATPPSPARASSRSCST